MDKEELENENIENTNIINESTEESKSIDKENKEEVNEQPIEEECFLAKKKHSPCMIATGILATLSFIGVVVILCMMFFCKGSSSDNSSSTTKVVQTGNLKIAYVNTDSIMAQYDYAKDLEKGLKTYQASLESNYQAQGNKLKSDYENYMKTGEKLTLTEQKRKEEDLQRRQQEFPALQQKMMAQLQERQLDDNKKLLNSVYAFIKDYNSKHQKFNIVLSRSYVSSTVLYADDGFDITKEIVKGLNEEYKEVKKK